MTIPASELVIVRALWGDHKIVGHEKVLWDIEHRTPKLTELLGNSIEQLCVTYGEHNQRFLESRSYRVLPADDETPQSYREHATFARRKRHGWIKGGVNMLWRKLDAIRVAFASEPQPRAVIFLDWDCWVLKAPDQQLLAMLEAGPEFQGRSCFAPKTTVAWRPVEGRLRWTIYVGGCYYFRSRQLLQDCIDAHATRFTSESDELAVTWVMDQKFGVDFRAVDNAELYANCRGMEKRGAPYFRHATMIGTKRFQQIKNRDPWALGWLRKFMPDYP